jgi:ribonuclease D
VNEMNQKLPYYMAYPMPLAYDDERVERMDLEYMKSLYPALAKRILPYIEEECDRMEYGNSVIYDEYPDRLQLQLMCGRIYENVRKNEERYLEIEKNAQLKDMIELMLYQELYNQRCRNRRTRNQFYINGSF